MLRIPVYVVLPPRALLLDLAGPLEVLRTANRNQDAVRFDVHYIGPSSSVVTSIGLVVSPIGPLPTFLPDDAMLVLPGDADDILDVDPKHTTPCQPNAGERIVSWLRAGFRASHTLIAICSGSLAAGRAGLLDGHVCTTHHASCAELARLAPRARVLENRIFVEDGNIYTSAGITAGIDLMLHVVSQRTSHACAAAIARHMVVYVRRSGSDPQLSPWLQGRNHLHPAVHRVQDAVTADPTQPWSLRHLSKVAGASSRHLSRLFHEHTGMSITDYKNQLRLTLAHQLLSQTSLDIENIAERAGFNSARQFRRVWQRAYARPPREIRKSFPA
ncbi:MAG: helix-turn-helix domain-containing protein [Acidobacteriaceae bacterium]